MSIDKATALVLLSVQIMVSGGCAHKAVKPEDVAAAKNSQATADADAKRFQEIMDMLYKLKSSTHEPESVPGADSGVSAAGPAKTDKASESPKVVP